MPIITKRRVKVIAFERERIVRRSVSMRCPVCQRPSELLTVRQAGALAQVRNASIYRWLAQGRAHGMRTSGGSHRVCRNSLFVARKVSDAVDPQPSDDGRVNIHQIMSLEPVRRLPPACGE